MYSTYILRIRARIRVDCSDTNNEQTTRRKSMKLQCTYILRIRVKYGSARLGSALTWFEQTKSREQRVTKEPPTLALQT